MRQRSLFEPRGSIQERFHAFDAEHPDVYALFKRFAQELKGRGRKRAGAKSIIERIRWEMPTSSTGEEFKIDNRFTSRYARKLIEECPEFAGFFELRKLQAL